jgi:DNA invertase Pin-like site-specific DNA recombinase
MIWGYARVSTQQQQLHLQLDALRAYGCQEVLREKASAL